MMNNEKLYLCTRSSWYNIGPIICMKYFRYIVKYRKKLVTNFYVL